MDISQLQITTGNWHAGLVQDSHLSQFFLVEPELAASVATRIYNQQNGYKNALSGLTTGAGKSKKLNSIVYRWPIVGDSRKAIAITRAVFDSAAQPGVAGSLFKVGAAEKWFTLGDILTLDDNSYSVRVAAEVAVEGNDYIYTLQLVTNDQTAFVPTALLQVGKELSKDFNAVEHDNSRTSGETHYSTPFMLENYMTTVRKSFSMTGAAHDRVLTIQLMNPDGTELASTWVKYNEWEFWQQWMDELEIMLMFGKTNVKANGTTDIKGPSGNPIYIGSGLEQQISASNKRYYTVLTEQLIRDFMSDLSFNGTEGGPRSYVAFCGRGFMDLFDQAMKTSAAKFVLVDNTFIKGSGQNLELGGQFMRYVGLNGDTIELKEYMPYNSTLRNRQLHPQTGKPVESYKATFLNFKTYSKGEPNIMRVYTREGVSTYLEGLYGPYGPKKNGTSATAVDGYEFHIMSECGIMLKDPTDAAQLLLDYSSIQ